MQRAIVVNAGWGGLSVLQSVYLYCYYAILEDRPRYHLFRYHLLRFHGMCRCGCPLDVRKVSSKIKGKIKSTHLCKHSSVLYNWNGLLLILKGRWVIMTSTLLLSRNVSICMQDFLIIPNSRTLIKILKTGKKYNFIPL